MIMQNSPTSDCNFNLHFIMDIKAGMGPHFESIQKSGCNFPLIDKHVERLIPEKNSHLMRIDL